MRFYLDTQDLHNLKVAFSEIIYSNYYDIDEDVESAIESIMDAIDYLIQKVLENRE